MHKFNMSFVSPFCILRLPSWIWPNPSTGGLKFESLSKWNPYEGFNLEHKMKGNGDSDPDDERNRNTYTSQTHSGSGISKFVNSKELSIYYFNQSFGRELMVVLGCKLFMFSKFSVHAWSWCVEVWTKNICIGSLGHCSWHVEMSATLNKLIWEVLCSSLHNDSKHVPKTYQTWRLLCAKQQTPDQNFGWIKRS